MSECSDKAGDGAKRRKKCPEFSKIARWKLIMRSVESYWVGSKAKTKLIGPAKVIFFLNNGYVRVS